MNKRGEGTGSKFLIGGFLAFTVLMLLANLMLNFGNSYNLKEIPEFESYRVVFNESQEIAQEYIVEGDLATEDEDGNFFAKIISNINERMEDNIFRKGLNIILTVPKLISLYVETLTISFGEIGRVITIPPEIIVFLSLFFGILIVTLASKAFMNNRNL